MNSVKLLKCLIVILLFVAGVVAYQPRHKKKTFPKIITLSSRGLRFEVATQAATVGEVLREQGYVADFPLTPSQSPPISSAEADGAGGEKTGADAFSPSRREGGDEEGVRSGMTIFLVPELKVAIVDGGTEIATTTDAITVNDLLLQKNIPLAVTDRVTPSLSTYLTSGLRIQIDRIVDLPETKNVEIPFQTVRKDSPGEYYGSENVVTAGAVGEKQRDFLVTYKNGVEVKRKLLREVVLRKPVTEIRTFGMHIEVVEVATGRASWYAYKSCLCAAHPFYDKGRYVRVTAVASGKSVIVRINDRGPELDKHPDRVIDLDVVAFRELAPAGAGTIEVKVELLHN